MCQPCAEYFIPMISCGFHTNPKQQVLLAGEETEASQGLREESVSSACISEQGTDMSL